MHGLYDYEDSLNPRFISCLLPYSLTHTMVGAQCIFVEWMAQPVDTLKAVFHNSSLVMVFSSTVGWKAWQGALLVYIYVAVYLSSWYSTVSQNRYTRWEGSPVGSLVYDVLMCIYGCWLLLHFLARFITKTFLFPFPYLLEWYLPTFV